MATAKEYRQRITNLGLDSLAISVSNKAEAEATLARLRELDQELKLMKRQLVQEVKEINASYSDLSARTASTSSSVLRLMGQRKIAGQVRADAKRNLASEKSRTTQPYEDVKLTIDDLLNQLAAAKPKLQDFIRNSKADEKSLAAADKSSPRKKSTAANGYCSQCGTALTAGSKFCHSCGARVA